MTNKKATKEDIDKTWNFIKDDFLREDGLIDWDKLKETFHDISLMEDQVSEVYMTITGGQMSKINYEASAVISAYEEELNKIFIEKPKHIDLDFVESEDWIAWTLKSIEEGKEVSEDEKLIVYYHSALFNYIENHKILLNTLEKIKKSKSIKEARLIAEEEIKNQK